MLSDLGAAILAAVNIMKIEITVFGFTVSFWGIMLYLLAGGVVIWLIGRLLS